MVWVKPLVCLAGSSSNPVAQALQQVNQFLQHLPDFFGTGWLAL